MRLDNLSYGEDYVKDVSENCNVTCQKFGPSHYLTRCASAQAPVLDVAIFLMIQPNLCVRCLLGFFPETYACLFYNISLIHCIAGVRRAELPFSS